MTLRTRALASAACFACVTAASALAQQPYPSRPVRIVVPYPPGGGNDIIARLLSEDLGRRLGQQMVIDNRPGGSTVIGADIVAHAPPDGYTVLVTSHTTYALIPNLRTKLPYDPERDFEPISLLATQSFALAVHPSLPASTVKQVITLAKAKPGYMTFSSAGAGSGTHFCGEQFKALAGIDILHVPYKGGSPAITAAISGETTMTFGSLSALAPFVTTRKLRIVGVTGAKRSPQAPEIPTIAESGLPGYQMTPWYGMVAPKGTPQAVIDRLHSAVVASVNSRDMQQRIASVGYEPEGSTPRQLAGHIKAELALYKQLIRTIGFRDD